MAKSKKQKHFSFKWIYLLVIFFVLYLGWILLALADVDGNPFGVNDGKIETYINLINMTGDGAEQYIELYKVSGSEDYELIMRGIEKDYKNLDRYESELRRHGVGEDGYINIMLESARLQLEGAKLQIMNLEGAN
ncbi:MAG: hypothetical protein ABIJ14_02455 [Nanoarchaeota archaeon]